MKGKRIFVFIFLILFLCQINALAMSAQSAVLIDAGTGRVLYSHNASELRGMASTTKIMTALVAIENGNLDDVATVSKNAAYQEGTSMYLKVGEKVTLKELLYGLLLSSGNDAAVAIAEHISGTVDEFALLMTNRAREIGAMQTTFKNPNGLDAEGHRTTAHDLAKITRVALQNPVFAAIVSTKSITLDRGTYTNHNKMLSMYEGATGVKTGFTKRCGRCLVSSAERNGFSLIAVTLNDPDDWNDHIQMFDNAYRDYQLTTPVTEGNEFGEVKVSDDESVKLLYNSNLHFYLTLEEQKRLELINNAPAVLETPIYKGQVVGSTEAYLDGVLLGKCDLVADRDVISKAKPVLDLKNTLYLTLLNWLNAFR